MLLYKLKLNSYLSRLMKLLKVIVLNSIYTHSHIYIHVCVYNVRVVKT